MLQSWPAYTVYSAMHFQDFVYWPPEPVARETHTKPSGSTHGKSAGEEEDYVFV